VERESMKKIIIYGAGDYGKRVFHMLKECGVSVFCFCKTSASEDEMCEGVRVIGLKDIDKYVDEYHDVIIALKDKTIVSDIKRQLLNKGFLLQQLIDMRSYFKDNIMTNATWTVGEKKCCICGNAVKDFLPSGEKTDLFLKHKIIGGGYRESVLCPACNSMDRERWLYHVLKEETDVFEGTCRVLHIAPEPFAYRMLNANPKCDYYAGDVVSGATMHKVDLTNVQFKDNFFDYVIANHVLEHIADERKAFHEIQRVLKKTGKLILSFPICMDMDTFENSDIVSDEERLKYYGQKDHVRLYGRDYKRHVEQYGWHVKEMKPQEYLSETEIKVQGLIAEDIIMVCTV